MIVLLALLWGGLSLVDRGALLTQHPLYQGGPNYLSAASGLCRVDGQLLVVADDGTELFVSGELFPLLRRQALPNESEARKQAKPDLESLTRIGSDFLAVGSGSTAMRTRGVLFGYLKGSGVGPIQEFDLEPLYGHLLNSIPQLNIEGMAALEGLGLLRLAHRGATSILIDLDLTQALAAARQGKAWTPEMIRAMTPVTLGTLREVPLAITDLSPLSEGRCAFAAAAEATENPVEDGGVTGSAVGILGVDGQVLSLATLDRAVKVEGIAAEEKAEGLRLFLVTDADDPAVPARLFSTWLPTNF